MEVEHCINATFYVVQDLESLLNKWGGFAVNIPELELLRQYHKDAVSWIARANNILLGISEKEDQETVAHELTCIQKDAALLRVKGLNILVDLLFNSCDLMQTSNISHASDIVDELPFVDIELKKAHCRVKALKVCRVVILFTFCGSLSYIFRALIKSYSPFPFFFLGI